jgi:DNA-directed RNA polymerase
MTKPKNPRYVTPAGTAQYPYLTKPDTKFNPDGEYKLKLEIPADQAQDIVTFLDEQHELAQAKAKKENAGKKIKEGNATIEWTTPSGFHVIQEYRKIELKPVQTRLLGQRMQTWLNKEWEDRQVDLNRSRTAASPNLIHSLDAALLHLVFAEWNKPFTVIHDCVLGRSCDMDQMAFAIRDKFVEIYSQPILKQWSESLGVEFDESVMQNTLDINDVQSSAYFFC